jgi:hypothetical protein
MIIFWLSGRSFSFQLFVIFPGSIVRHISGKSKLTELNGGPSGANDMVCDFLDALPAALRASGSIWPCQL